MKRRTRADVVAEEPAVIAKDIAINSPTPKLTDVQRRCLEKAAKDVPHFVHRESITTRHYEALLTLGLLRRTASFENGSTFAVTDAGRAALRGES